MFSFSANALINNFTKSIVYFFVYLLSHCETFVVFVVFQNHDFPSETELPSGLRGCNQQADQPGAVRLLRLPVHGESPVAYRGKR